MEPNQRDVKSQRRHPLPPPGLSSKPVGPAVDGAWGEIMERAKGDTAMGRGSVVDIPIGAGAPIISCIICTR